MRATLRALLALAVVGGVGVVAAPAAQAHEHYECVRYPCYPEDYPPYLIDTVTGLIPR